MKSIIIDYSFLNIDIVCLIISNGDYDHLPEQAFYMVGTIEEAVEKAKTL